MNPEVLPKRLRLALPFAILAEPGVVRLVAGEEFRYTLRSPSLDCWLPAFLRQFANGAEWRLLIEPLSNECRPRALDIIGRLYGERVLVGGSVEETPLPSPLNWMVEGGGELSARLRAAIRPASDNAARMAVLCQDSLDYAAALNFNRRCRRSAAAGWLWISTGAMGRGFVSPIFRPDAGPCLECLTRNFQRLSPNPEIYDHLIQHAEAGGEIPAVPFPTPARQALADLAWWKIDTSSQANPSSAIYRLHVLEIDTMECSSHRVFRDPHCPACCQQ